MGVVIPFPSRSRDWTNVDRDIFARLIRFYKRCSLVNSFVEIIDGRTDENEPWISFIRSDGEVIISVTKIYPGPQPRYVIKYRSHVCELDDLTEFADQLLVEELATGNGASS